LHIYHIYVVYTWFWPTLHIHLLRTNCHATRMHVHTHSSLATYKNVRSRKPTYTLTAQTYLTHELHHATRAHLVVCPEVVEDGERFMREATLRLGARALNEGDHLHGIHISIMCSVHMHVGTKQCMLLSMGLRSKLHFSTLTMFEHSGPNNASSTLGVACVCMCCGMCSGGRKGVFA